MNSSATGAIPDAAPLPPAPPYPQKDRSLLRHFSRIDVAMLVLWVMSTSMPLSWGPPVRYLVAAYFLAGMFLFSRQTMPATARAWPTFVLPILSVVSAIWAPVPGEAIRGGLLFALTAVAAIYAASRLSGRQILFGFFIAESVAAVLCIMNPVIIGGAWNGIFGQKNFMAVHMFILYVTALGLLFDRESHRWIRTAAFVVAPVALALVLFTRSATTTLVLIGATLALVGQFALWEPARRVRHLRTFIALLLAVIILSAILLIFGLMQFDAAGSLLNALGKDSTLTGRTYLWEIAERTMAEHPLTGVGAGGFWRPEYGLANSITQYFFYDRYTHFSFHNAYLENGVAFGYPGYWATIFLAGWAIWSASLNWFKNQNSVNAAFFVLAIMIIIRTTAEIDIAQPFTATSTLLFIGAIRSAQSPSRSGGRQFPGTARRPGPQARG